MLPIIADYLLRLQFRVAFHGEGSVCDLVEIYFKCGKAELTEVICIEDNDDNLDGETRHLEDAVRLLWLFVSCIELYESNNK